MKVLKVEIYQPTAHYRVPFTYITRETYPLPPYSTVIGFLCNMLGIGKREVKKQKKLRNGLSLAIYGKYEGFSKEYVWLRNIYRESHMIRFGTRDNRTFGNSPEHPGGQFPVIIKTLEDVHLLFYIKHPDENFLNEMYEDFKTLKKRTTIPHLGRPEDLIVIQNLELIEIDKTPKPVVGRLKNYRFTWLVDPNRGPNFVDTDLVEDKLKYISDYEEFFKKVPGTYQFITSFYEVVNRTRSFDKVPVKLYEGGAFPLIFGNPLYTPHDGNLPLFFTKFTGGEL